MTSWLDIDHVLTFGQGGLALHCAVDCSNSGRVPPGAGRVDPSRFVIVEHVPPDPTIEGMCWECLQSVEQSRVMDGHDLNECPVTQLIDQRKDVLRAILLDSIGGLVAAE